MFTKAKNIDTALRQQRIIFLMTLAFLLALTTFIAYRCIAMVEKQSRKIYVIADGKAFEAYISDKKTNLPIQARGHVETFHQFFFGLEPDEKVIDYNITKALYLADGSAKRQYDNLKEQNYYSNIISANISQRIYPDSIVVSTDKHPYYFRYYGTMEIIRTSTVTTRSLVTEGYLRNTRQSENNTQGFLIERWRILENRDINTKAR